MAPDGQPTDVYAALRAGVPGFDYVSNGYDDDEGFKAGLSRVTASVVGGIVTVAGEGSVTNSPQLTAYVFTETTIIEWAWTPVRRSPFGLDVNWRRSRSMTPRSIRAAALSPTRSSTRGAASPLESDLGIRDRGTPSPDSSRTSGAASDPISYQTPASPVL